MDEQTFNELIARARRCDKCLYSEPMITVNGEHRICTFTYDTMCKCLVGAKDYYFEGKEDTNDSNIQ